MAAGGTVAQEGAGGGYRGIFGSWRRGEAGACAVGRGRREEQRESTEGKGGALGERCQEPAPYPTIWPEVEAMCPATFLVTTLLRRVRARRAGAARARRSGTRGAACCED